MRVALVCFAGMLIGITPVSAAGDVKAGRQKALQCQTCHGLDGTAKLPEAPNLAGQTEVYANAGGSLVQRVYRPGDGWSGWKAGAWFLQLWPGHHDAPARHGQVPGTNSPAG